MFSFASRLKLWVKFAIQIEQPKVIIARTSSNKGHWNCKHNKTNKPWNFWKFPMIILPSVLESQSTGYEDCNNYNINQMKISIVDKKLGFFWIASIEAMYSIMGWLKLASDLHTRAKLEKDNDDKDPSKNYDPSNEVEQAHAANFVERIIKTHAIVVFSKSYCPFCKKTKTIFLEESVRPHVVELNLRDDGEYIQDVLLKITGRRTVPQVFIYGVFVGGCNDLVDMKECGKLHELLKKMPPPDYYKPQKPQK